MRLLKTIAGLRAYLDLNRLPSTQVGFVPTMGALHQGHLSLIQRARSQNDLVIVSIFVNPLQFGPNEDLDRYPRTLEQDQKLCQTAGVDVLFVPSKTELGINSNITQVVPDHQLTSVLCGRNRVGHFQGVATIVLKLFNLVQPSKAYFGQKDAQQVAILNRMVRDLNIGVDLITCPTVREPTGLALSSRNQYLTPTQKEIASIIYRSLTLALSLFQKKERSPTRIIAEVKTELGRVKDLEVEYIDLVDPVTLEPKEHLDQQGGLLAIAARLGSTRLIDNIVLSEHKAIIAIDGPAGAGKSTVARQVANQLGLLYLNTGTMYRAVTWLVQELGISIDDQVSIAELASTCEIKLALSDDPTYDTRVWINKREVTQAIRDQKVTNQVSAIAAQKQVRLELVKQQQLLGANGGVVADGRDIGTHVFPAADLKIFLNASLIERAKRRQQDLIKQGHQSIDLDELQQAIKNRDANDSNRSIAPLVKAPDAIEIITDQLTIQQVCDQIVGLYYDKINH